MPVGAPYGNRNAEKWTFKKAIMLFNDAIELTEIQEVYFYKQNDKAVEVNGMKYDFIGEIAKELGTFRDIFKHLKERFPSLERKYNCLITNLESNCYLNTKKGMIKEATGIVNLKSNHKWTDRNETNHSGEIKTDNIIHGVLFEVINPQDEPIEGKD